MINANELRIGNKILYEGKICTVNNLFPNNIRVEEVSIYDQLNHESFYEEILLTPEILKQWGFEERQEGFNHFYSKKYTHVLVESVFELTYLDEKTYAWVTGNTIVHVSYLHEVQNLYFAVAKEELKRSL